MQPSRVAEERPQIQSRSGELKPQETSRKITVYPSEPVARPVNGILAFSNEYVKSCDGQLSLRPAAGEGR